MTRTTNGLPRVLMTVAACAALALSGCGGDSGGSGNVPDGSVAVVAGKPITQATYDKWLAITNREAKAGGSTLDEKALRKRVLSTLVRAAWTEAEAARQGIPVPQAGIDALYRQTKKLTFAGDKTFAQYMQQSGLTKADLLFRLRIAALNQKLVQKAQAKAGGPDAKGADQALRQFNRGYDKRWKAKTSCRDDLVTPDCANAG